MTRSSADPHFRQVGVGCSCLCIGAGCTVHPLAAHITAPTPGSGSWGGLTIPVRVSENPQDPQNPQNTDTELRKPRARGLIALHSGMNNCKPHPSSMPADPFRRCGHGGAAGQGAGATGVCLLCRPRCNAWKQRLQVTVLPRQVMLHPQRHLAPYPGSDPGMAAPGCNLLHHRYPPPHSAQVIGLWPEYALLNHSCAPSTISYVSRCGGGYGARAGL